MFLWRIVQLKLGFKCKASNSVPPLACWGSWDSNGRLTGLFLQYFFWEVVFRKEGYKFCSSYGLVEQAAIQISLKSSPSPCVWFTPGIFLEIKWRSKETIITIHYSIMTYTFKNLIHQPFTLLTGNAWRLKHEPRVGAPHFFYCPFHCVRSGSLFFHLPVHPAAEYTPSDTENEARATLIHSKSFSSVIPSLPGS